MPSGYARRKRSRPQKPMDLCNCGHVRSAHHIFQVLNHTYGCHKCACVQFNRSVRPQMQPRIPFPSR